MNDLVKIMSAIVKDAASAIRYPFRGRLSTLSPKTPVQTMQVEGLPGEVLQGMEFMQHFGFTSSPPCGTQCILLPLGGKTVHSIVIATENGSFRVAVDQGETCVYNQWGAKITLKKDKIVEVDCDHFIVKAKESVDIQTKSLTQTASQNADYASPALSFGGTDGELATAVMRANIVQDGSHVSTGDHKAGSVSLMEHTHRENGTGGGTTSKPD